MPINPPIQTPTIPKAPAKATIDGIPFNAFPTKICKDSYANVYRHRSLVLEQQLHLDSFKDTNSNFVYRTLMDPSSRIHQDCLSSYCPSIRFKYIEHFLDESYLKSSLFGIVVEVTLEMGAEVLGIPLVDAPSVSELEVTIELLDRVLIDLWGTDRGQLGIVVHNGSLSQPAWVLATFLSYLVYPSSHQVDICGNGCGLSQILHREPINLASCIIDKMILREDLSVSKKEVLPKEVH